MKALSTRIAVVALPVLLLSCSQFPARDNPFDGTIPPSALESRLHSVHIATTNPPGEQYTVIIELAGDGAEAIDAAWFDFARRPVWLQPTETDVWTRRLNGEFFDDPDLRTIKRQPFFLHARDGLGIIYDLPAAYVPHVFMTVPELEWPANGEIVDPHPVLRWRAYHDTVRFEYRVRLDIWEDDGSTLTLGGTPRSDPSDYRRDDLPDWTLSIQPLVIDSTYVVIADSLPDGIAIWTVAVVDMFGDSARSREGHFAIDVERALAGNSESESIADRR